MVETLTRFQKIVVLRDTGLALPSNFFEEESELVFPSIFLMLVCFIFLIPGEPKKTKNKKKSLLPASLQPILYILKLLPILYDAFLGYLLSRCQDKASGPLVTISGNKY